MRRFFVAAMLVFYANFSCAAAVPAYTGGINNSVGSIIQSKTVKWGFAANDPRFGATVSAVGTAATTVAAGLATGAVATVGWPALLIGAGVSALVTGAISLGQNALISWLWPDATHPGQVQLSGTGMNGQTPVFSNGISSGQLAWTVSGAGGYWGSPQEAISYMFAGVIAQYPDAQFTNVVVAMNSQTAATITYSYNYPSSLKISGTGTKTATALTFNGMTCPAGYGFVSGSACTSAGLGIAGNPFSASWNPTWQTPAQAVASLPQSYATQPLSDAQLAAIANALWKNMASASNSQTIPWNSSDPITPSDVAAWRAANPSLVPTVNDFLSPVAPTGATSVTVPNPGTTATTPTPSTTPGTTTSPAEIDWGSFNAPQLDPTPTTESILGPIFSLWPQWAGYSFPSHNSACPTPTFTVLNHTFVFDQMCSWVELIRPAVQAAFALVWALMVVFIVMGA